MPNQPVPAAATGLPNSTQQPHHRLGDRVVVEMTGTITSRIQQTDHFAIQPDDPCSSSIHVKPEYIFPEDSAPLLAPAAAPPNEPGIEITEAGRAYLLLESIVSRLSIDGGVASFTLTPSLAADIAAWQAKVPPEKNEDGEASDLLRLLIKRSDATVVGNGKVHLDLDLTNSEMDWLCSWNSESEDLEDDDPAEDSDPAEDGHDNEKDVWYADDQSDEKAVQVQLAGKLEPMERKP
jgi:hypothetical protein